MSLELVTARARTRGKSPVEFQYQAVGRLKPRKVLDKDQNPVVVDDKNESVKYSISKDGKSTDNENIKIDEKGNLFTSGNLRIVEVDDVETTSLTEDFNDVLTLLGSLTEEERGKRTPLQMAIDSTLEGFNYNSRKNAAPVTEQVTEDELTPITVAFVEKQLMTDTEATTWRRTITQAAKLMEMERLDYVKLAPQYKKLLATGWKYPVAA